LVKALEGFTSCKWGHVISSDDVSRLLSPQAKILIPPGIFGGLEMESAIRIDRMGRQGGVDSCVKQWRTLAPDLGGISATDDREACCTNQDASRDVRE